MAYSELVKDFDRIRDYMRQFYIYDFKSRTQYDKKSARSYDNERRRIESWLGDFMHFRQTADGKNVFLSVDSRTIPGRSFLRPPWIKKADGLRHLRSNIKNQMPASTSMLAFGFLWRCNAEKTYKTNPLTS